MLNLILERNLVSEVAAKTQIEELPEQSAQAQRALASAQAQTSALVREHSILSARLEFPPPSASIEEITAWRLRRDALPPFIRRAQAQEQTAETQLRLCNERWHTLKVHRAQLEQTLSELEARLKPGGPFDQRVQLANQKLREAENLFRTAEDERGQTEAQARELRARLERLGDVK